MDEQGALPPGNVQALCLPQEVPQPQALAQPAYVQAAPVELITPSHHPMPAYGMAHSAPIEMRDASGQANLEFAVKTSEHQVIMAAIQSTDSRMEAAAKLGISPRTLRYKLAQLRERGMHEGVSA